MVTVRFPSSEVRRLGTVLEVCARVYDYPTLDAWRADLLRHVLLMLDAPMGYCAIPSLGLREPDAAVGYAPEVFEQWVQHWRAQDPMVELLSRLRLRVYTRRYLQRVAGPEWTRRYRRSPVVTDFYHRFGLLHGAGIFLNSEDAHAHLHVEVVSRRSDHAERRSRALLTAVEPGFRAAVAAAGQPRAGHLSAATLLDSTAVPAALLDAAGRWVHRTPAFAAALDAVSAAHRVAVIDALVDLATGVFANASRASGHPQRAPGLQLHGVSAHAVLVGSNVLLRLQPTRRRADQRRLEDAGLTPREMDVAVLVASGHTAKQIAAQLDISWHTARRHTERVLRKLDVSSRSGVAAILRAMP
jgi:DNA-binding CsgD family transcriptional regulator